MDYQTTDESSYESSEDSFNDWENMPSTSKAHTIHSRQKHTPEHTFDYTTEPTTITEKNEKEDQNQERIESESEEEDLSEKELIEKEEKNENSKEPQTAKKPIKEVPLQKELDSLPTVKETNGKDLKDKLAQKKKMNKSTTLEAKLEEVSGKKVKEGLNFMDETIQQFKSQQRKMNHKKRINVSRV